MKKISLLFFFFTLFSTAQESATFFELADDFFRIYVENGKVKYAEIKQNRNELNRILNEAKKVKISEENEDEYLAFWINAYNLAAIKGIVDNYPVASPLEIEGFFAEMQHSLDQKSVSLDEIEHDLLFGNFPEEARLHFVLVCAARGCPPLISEAYRPDIIEKQLQQQTQEALSNPDFVNLEDDKVLFSEILKWYKEDFTGKGKSLIEFVNQYREDKIPPGMDFDFYEYDWNLNDF